MTKEMELSNQFEWFSDNELVYAYDFYKRGPANNVQCKQLLDEIAEEAGRRDKNIYQMVDDWESRGGRYNNKGVRCVNWMFKQ